uniref:Uncharacterized protein n=1 Tax=Lotus japonicus TaxID=34305 RepID=I3SY41_LOTJA|nr:unknown [Lotus japonicus]
MQQTEQCLCQLIHLRLGQAYGQPRTPSRLRLLRQKSAEILPKDYTCLDQFLAP